MRSPAPTEWHANCSYTLFVYNNHTLNKNRNVGDHPVFSCSQEWWHWCLHSNGAFLSGRCLAGPWHWISFQSLHPSTQRLSSSLSFSSTSAASASASTSSPTTTTTTTTTTKQKQKQNNNNNHHHHRHRHHHHHHRRHRHHHHYHQTKPISNIFILYNCTDRIQDFSIRKKTFWIRSEETPYIAGILMGMQHTTGQGHGIISALGGHLTRGLSENGLPSASNSSWFSPFVQETSKDFIAFFVRCAAVRMILGNLTWLNRLFPQAAQRGLVSPVRVVPVTMLSGG